MRSLCSEGTMAHPALAERHCRIGFPRPGMQVATPRGRVTHSPRFALRGIPVLASFIVACTSSDNGFDDAMSPSSNASGGSANDSVKMPQLLPPEFVGPLVGPEAAPISGLKLFGTDLGLPFVHRGRHEILFGDTMP